MGRRTVKKRTSWQPAWLQGTDGWLVFAVMSLLLWGLLMVYSTSPEYQWWHGARTASGGVDILAIIRRQTLFVLIGIGVAVFLASVDYHVWEKLALVVLILIWLALGAVLVLKPFIGGTGRFLFGGSVQPSELAKIATVFYLSVWLAHHRDGLQDWQHGLYPLGFLVGVTAALVMMEPDFSAAATIVLLGVLLFFLAGGSLRQIILVGLMGFLGAAAVLFLYPNGMHRLAVYLEGLHDPAQAAEQIRKALTAVARGGWFGVGPGQSQIKLSGLPLPHSDSVFAVVAEEYGLVGASLMVILFGIIVWRGMRIALRAPDTYGRLLASGLSLWLGLEAFSNMAMMLNLLPLAGNALPFISYGGSSLLNAMIAVGLILSVGRASARTEISKRRDTGEVVSLRRGNRRRRVSRAVGTSGARR